MEVYLAYESVKNAEYFELIGVFKTKEGAILAVEQVIQYGECKEFIEISTVGDKSYWIERGMDVAFLGYVEKTKLEE